MSSRLFLALFCALLLFRLPSVVQPMGADQGLYAYVGDRILAGGVPYRDAWDQKPPAIHYTYAALRLVWPHDSAVAAADLFAAAAIAWVLFRMGPRVASAGAGAASALIFLFLSNPSFTRLSGIRLRAQCETFIAVAVTAALLLLVRKRDGARAWALLAGGAAFGTAFAFKYNAGLYAAAGVAALAVRQQLTPRSFVLLCAGFAVPPLLLALPFLATGTLADLQAATIAYNVHYSGETYRGLGHAVGYLLSFPVERARVDALWTVGGAGCLILIAAARRDWNRLLAPLWVAAACLSIAVNGSRGLPQYFVQANPALALAAGWGAVVAWQAVRSAAPRRAAIAGLVAVTLVAVGVWRVNQFPKLIEQTMFDARYAAGAITRTDYLARYDDDRKFSALDADQLATYLREHSGPADHVYVFGFTCGAYVNAPRISSSRFFWSRPVIAGFMNGVDGYGAAGVLDDLRRDPPAVVALQRKDWAPDVSDSAAFFHADPALEQWLTSGYTESPGPAAFELWLRKDAAR